MSELVLHYTVDNAGANWIKQCKDAGERISPPQMNDNLIISGLRFKISYYIDHNARGHITLYHGSDQLLDPNVVSSVLANRPRGYSTAQSCGNDRVNMEYVYDSHYYHEYPAEIPDPWDPEGLD